MTDTRDDAFLGGRLKIRQPVRGYRAGVDPVLLAASIPAKPGDSALDLGCGVGVAGLCLARRIPGVSVTGLERHAAYAALAVENAQRNHIDMKIEQGDVADVPAAIKARRYDHVLVNPPYFDRASTTPARDVDREAAMGESTPLAVWVAAAARRAAPQGTVTFIHRAARLPELLVLMAAGLGSLEVLPLLPRERRAPRLVLVRGRKGGRAEFCLHAGWVLHAGAHHAGDGENYAKATTSVLRDGAPLPFG